MSIELARPKEYSPALQQKIAYCNTLHNNAKDAVMSVYTQALNDGFAATEAKRICLTEIKFFGKSQIYRYLPVESKDYNKSKAGKARRMRAPQSNSNGFEVRRLRRLYEDQIALMKREFSEAVCANCGHRFEAS